MRPIVVLNAFCRNHNTFKRGSEMNFQSSGCMTLVWVCFFLIYSLSRFIFHIPYIVIDSLRTDNERINKYSPMQIVDDKAEYVRLQNLFGVDFDFLSTFGKVKRFKKPYDGVGSDIMWMDNENGRHIMEGEQGCSGEIVRIYVFFWLGENFWVYDDFWSKFEETIVVSIDYEKNEIALSYNGPDGYEPEGYKGTEAQNETRQILGEWWRERVPLEQGGKIIKRVSNVLAKRGMAKPFVPGGAYSPCITKRESAIESNWETIQECRTEEGLDVQNSYLPIPERP